MNTYSKAFIRGSKYKHYTHTYSRHGEDSEGQAQLAVDIAIVDDTIVKGAPTKRVHLSLDQRPIADLGGVSNV